MTSPETAPQNPKNQDALAAVRAVIGADMAQVDNVIRARLSSEVALINQISGYIIGAGGKRLRPVLVLLSGLTFNAVPAKLHELAAVIEFIHTATLLHDDVVDESDLRRGKATANAEFGNGASVLVGDFLYSRAFQMMVGVGSMDVMRVLAEATNIISEGEVLQLMNIGDADIDEVNYLRVVRYKTAKLFEAAARVGALVGDANAVQLEQIAQYGMHLGTAFQLIDDVLDYSGEATEIGKNLGDDLAEGKPTLPLIYALRTGNAAQQSIIRDAIEGANDPSITVDIAQVVATLNATGALDYTRACARREAETARDAVANLPASAYRTALMQLAAFSVDRRY